MIRLVTCFQIVRIHNSFAAAFATLLGVYLAVGTTALFSIQALAAALVVALMVAVNNAVNDLLDLRVDRHQKPHRPLPSGKLSRRWVIAMGLVLFLLALSIAWILSPGSFFFALTAGFLGFAYSLFFKSTVLLGNAIVGLLSGITVLYGGYVMGDLRAEIVIATFIIFGFIFLREILKTVNDMKGDTLAGITTISTRFGFQNSLRIFYVFTFVFALAAISPWVLYQAPDRYLIAISLGVVVPLIGVVCLISKQADQKSVRMALRITKVVWFSGLFALALLK